MQTKKCTKCKQVRGLEDFSKDKSKKSGFRSHCKVCRKQYDKQWQKNNAEYMKQYNKRRNKQWYKDNAERRKRYYKHWRTENREYMKRWCKDNKDALRIHQQKRRAMKLSTCDGTVTKEFLNSIWKGKCFYCKCGITRAEAHIEHKTPLSIGGKHSKYNVVWACGTCNHRKFTKTADEYFATLQNGR